jgi:DNA-binding Xre family transcriptional regulator
MLKYNIKNLMKQRGIFQPYAFLMKNGFSRSEAQRITGARMVAIMPGQVERLCLALKCMPNDLFCWTADKGEAADEGHLLWALRERELESLADVGKGVPKEKMDEFLEAVKRLEDGMKD